MLGLILARNGINVAVAEKEAKPSITYKGELLQPKSLEMMNWLGLYEDARASGFPIHTTSITEYDGDRIMKDIDYHYNVIDHPFNEALMVPHETLKEIIRKHAERHPHFHFLNPAKFTGFQETGHIKKQHLSFIKNKVRWKLKQTFSSVRKVGCHRSAKAWALN